jgi:hypothetical protein
LGISKHSGRSDMARAMAWAIKALVEYPAPQPFFVY